jgi:hypothetical protein
MQVAKAVRSKAVLMMPSEYSQEAVRAFENKEIRIDFVAASFSEAANWIVQEALNRKGS